MIKSSKNGSEALNALAQRSGLAVAFVGGENRELSVVNNNSICRTLNPTGVFTPDCARFCGKAFEKAFEAGGPVGFVCHAGLDCRAVPVKNAEQPFVAIVGRTFLRSENYRKATQRAMAGDWSGHSPAELFDNVLLSGSPSMLERATRQAQEMLEAGPPEPSATPAPEPASEPEAAADTVDEALPNRADTSTWRSFFGSILRKDYSQATSAIVELIAGQYGFESVIWLERRGARFEQIVGTGALRARKVRLGISPDDQRLIEAFNSETPLELGERRKGTSSARVMYLFPMGLDGEVSAAVAVLDAIDSDETKRQIARMCHSIAPQIEILRLRNEVSGGEAIANALRTFGEGLKRIDEDDLWQNLTQKTAEILHAERASLLVIDEKSGGLEIKALIGAATAVDEAEPGSRVARIVFAKNTAVIVSDVSRTGLPPSPPDRNYKTSSFLSCPINAGDRTIGVMSFTDRAGGESFDRGSLDLFQAISPQLAVAIDHALLKEKAGEFEQLSVTDPLTGLLNRRYIEARLIEEIKRSNRHGYPMSFMMLDVDHFKSYNDLFGHPAGDEALRLVGHVIRETLRGADVAARFGGEEFSILLPQTTGEEAATIAERIRSNIEETPFPHRPVTASIGIASCSAELCVSADLISAADKALYEAKRRGRNRVLAFESMTAQGVVANGK